MCFPKWDVNNSHLIEPFLLHIVYAQCWRAKLSASRCFVIEVWGSMLNKYGHIHQRICWHVQAGSQASSDCAMRKPWNMSGMGMRCGGHNTGTVVRPSHQAALQEVPKATCLPMPGRGVGGHSCRTFVPAVHKGDLVLEWIHSISIHFKSACYSGKLYITRPWRSAQQLLLTAPHMLRPATGRQQNSFLFRYVKTSALLMHGIHGGWEKPLYRGSDRKPFWMVALRP